MTSVRDLRSGRIPQWEVDPPANRSGEVALAAFLFVLQQTLVAAFGRRLDRLFTAWPGLLTALALLCARPTGVAALAESQGMLEVTSDLGQFERPHRVVDPLRCQVDGEASAFADLAEESEDSEAEELAAADQVECVDVHQFPFDESRECRSSHVAAKLVEWLREHHAPRGPPLS